MVSRYRIEHSTVYRYSDEVSTSFGRGYLRPGTCRGSAACSTVVTVEPAPSDISHAVDVYGNTNTYFHVTNSHTELRVVGLSDVEVTAAAIDPAVTRDALGAGAAVRSPTDAKAVEFTLASPLVRMPPQVQEYARVSFPPGRPIIEAVTDLTHRIYTEFKYQHGATSVSSTVRRRAGGEGRRLPGLRAPGHRLPALGGPRRAVRVRATCPPDRRRASRGRSAPTPATPGPRCGWPTAAG